MSRFRSLLVASAAAAALAFPAAAQEAGDSLIPRWPVEFETDSGVLVVYLPQIETFANNQLTARAAFSYAKGEAAPRFGTFWFTARVDVDRDANLVTARSITVTRVRFPDITAQQQEQFEAFVKSRLEEQELSASLDRIVALVAATDLERSTAEGIRTEPPRIVVMSQPAVLLLFDGDPIYRQMSDAPYQRVVNTAMAVARDTATGIVYLAGGGWWYQARNPMGPWDVADSVPASLRALVPDTMDFDTPDGPPPRIVTAKEPTELIVTDGPMQLQPVQGATGLRYAANTESDILKDATHFYVLLSGRWYRATEMAGPWQHVRPDSLPRSFASIYPTSAAADVLAFVPGTPQADEAVADAMIPQTTAIRRDAATLTVAYDGEPDFEAIPGTQIEWAYNTETPVMRIGGLYYACDNAVWFVSRSATGPWAVSDSVPQAVQSIPASSPVYNVKYVQVYQSTPEVVYVGYTPGYMGVYPYYGTMVYGTGYPYPPYMGVGAYYPRPVTFGFHFTYNPYTGWGAGVSVGGPFLRVGVAFRPPYPAYRPAGMYGPAGYRPPGGGYAGAGARPGTRPAAGARPATRPSNNLYNRPGNATRNAARPSTGARTPGARPAGTRPSTGMGGAARPGAGARPNNVFAAPNGNVMRQQGGNWQQQRSNGSWGNASRGSTPSSMNRDAQARSRGSSREMGRSSYGGSRGGGGMRGGGGGRRR